MKVRKQAKIKSQSVVQAIWTNLAETSVVTLSGLPITSKTVNSWIIERTFADLAQCRRLSIKASYDHAAQGEARLYATYDNGITTVYRRFRRTNIYIRCYERAFFPADHQWFTLLRPSEHFVTVKTVKEAIERQEADRVARRIRRLSEYWYHQGVKLLDKNEIGCSAGNTRFMMVGRSMGKTISKNQIQRFAKETTEKTMGRMLKMDPYAPKHKIDV